MARFRRITAWWDDHHHGTVNAVLTVRGSTHGVDIVLASEGRGAVEGVIELSDRDALRLAASIVEFASERAAIRKVAGRASTRSTEGGEQHG